MEIRLNHEYERALVEETVKFLQPIRLEDEVEIFSESSIISPLSVPWNAAKYIPHKIPKVNVDLWPPWDARVWGKYEAKIQSTGLPILGASFRDRPSIRSHQILDKSQALGTFSGTRYPTFEWQVKGWDIVKALWDLLVHNKVRIKGKAKISGLFFSKTFDVDCSVPVKH